MTTKTKGKLADFVAKQLGITTRTQAASPEQIADIIDFMDMWASSQNAIGRRIGYNFTDSKPEAESGIPSWAEQGVWSSVAVLMCPYYEKQATPELMASQRVGMSTIYNETIELQKTQYPNRMPIGSGNRRNTYGPRYYRKSDRISTDGDFLKDEGGDIITGDGE